jgi:hypothetical protein
LDRETNIIKLSCDSTLIFECNLGNDNKSNKSNPVVEVVGGILDADVYRRKRMSTPIGEVHVKEKSTEITRKKREQRQGMRNSGISLGKKNSQTPYPMLANVSA